MSHCQAIIETMAARIPGFNLRPLSLDDLSLLCDLIEIEIIHMPLRKLHGIAIEEGGYRCMYINHLLSFPYRVIAGFHEFCHFFFHSIDSRVCLSTGGLVNLSKRERQAQTIGVIALMPSTLIREMSVEDIMREFEVSRQIAEFRVSLRI